MLFTLNKQKEAAKEETEKNYGAVNSGKEKSADEDQNILKKQQKTA